MFTGDWLRTATGIGLVCGLSIMLGVFALAIVLDEQSNRDAERYCSENPTQCNMGESGTVIGSPTPAESQPQWWERSDLDAQRKMARWTTVIGVLTGGGVLLLAWTLWETRQVTQETRRIGITQTQAYLVVTEIGLELAQPDVITTEKDGVVTTEFYFFYWLKVKNYGQSPAYDVSGKLNIGWQPLLRFGGAGQINRLSAGSDMRAGFDYSGPIAPQATSKVETWGMIPVSAEKLMRTSSGPHAIVGYMPYGFGDIQWINEYGQKQEAKVSVPGAAHLSPLKATGNSVPPIVIKQN